MASFRVRERGFVLIGAIWLLVLAGTVGAALLLRSLGEARTASAESRAFADLMALDGAVESAFASLLFHGQASRLASGAGTVVVGGMPAGLSLSSEGSRLDLNEADPEVVGGVLQALGVRASERTRILAALNARRGERRRLASPAELRSLLGPEGVRLEDAFTIYSGSALPPASGALGAWLKGMVSPQRTPAPVELRAGTPVRIEAALPGGARLTAVARLTGVQEDPLAVHRWEFRSAGPEASQTN